MREVVEDMGLEEASLLDTWYRPRDTFTYMIVGAGYNDGGGGGHGAGGGQPPGYLVQAL
jgi:hypothetical protein